MRLFILFALILGTHISELYGQCMISVTCRPTPPKVECACEIEEIRPEFIGIEATGNEDVLAFESLGFSVSTTGNCGRISVTANDNPHHPEDCQDSFFIERIYSLRSEFTGNRPTCRDTFHTEFIPAHFLGDAQDVEISCEDNVDSLFQVFKDSLSFTKFLNCNNDVRAIYQPDADPALAVEQNCNGGAGCGEEMFVRPLITIFGPCHDKCLTLGDKDDKDEDISFFCVRDEVPAVLTCPSVASPLDLGDDRLEMKIDSIIEEYDLTFGCSPPLISNDFGIDSVDFASCVPQQLIITITAEEPCPTNSDQCSFTVEIINEQGPTITFVPDSLMLECGMVDIENALNNWSAQASAIDFRGFTLGSNDITTNFNPSLVLEVNCDENFPVTFTARDFCGRTTTEMSGIQIRDTESPNIISCPSDTLFNADDPNLTTVVNEWLGRFSASDQCNPNFIQNSTFNPNWLSFSCGTIDTTIVFSADDLCDETAVSTCEVDLVILDNVTYGFSSFPNDTTIQCENPINTGVLSQWISTAVGMSSLGQVFPNVSADLDFTDPRLLSCDVVIDVLFTYENDCGVIVSDMASLTITDDVIPTITCPADITFTGTFDDILPDITTWLGSAIPLDNCSARATNFFDAYAFQGCADTLSNPITFFASDECGNESPRCQANLTLITDKNPVITCPPRIVFECGEPGILDSIERWEQTVVSTNFVGIAIQSTNTLNIANITLETCLQETMVTFTVNDSNCSRTDFCETSITIQDSQSPNIICPLSQLTINSNSTTIDQDVADWIATAEFDDNGCRTPQFFTDPPLDNIDFCNRTDQLSMTFTVVDPCLNESSCIGLINFNTQGPDISCPPNLILECGEDNLLGQIDDWLLNVTAIDNDTNDLSPLVTNNFMPDMIEARCNLPIQILFETADGCGTPSSCVSNIQILDTTAPEVDCPTTPLNLLAGDTTKIPKFLTWLELIPVIDCNDFTTTSDFDQNLLAGFDCDEIQYNLDIRVEDNCGLISNCQGEIFIQNNITTSFINCVPGTNDLELECGSMTMNDDIQQWMAQVTAVDLNNNPFPTVPSIDPDDPSLLQCSGSTPVFFELSDQCGVGQSCMLTLTITDTQRPVPNCPQDTSFVLEDPNFDANVDSWLLEIDGDDDCIALLNFGDDYTQVTSLANCVSELPVPVTFTVGDGCGNISNCTSILTVTTDQVPVISCPPNRVIECGDPNTTDIIADWIEGVEGADANNDPLIPEFNFDIADVTSINCDGSVRVLFTIEDACNIMDTCSSVIIVEDTTAPDAVCPDLLTINTTDPDGPQKMQDWLDSFTPTDNCSMAIPSIQNGIMVPSVFCNSPEEIDVEFYAEDACGMRDTCFATIIVNKAIPIIDCQDRIEVECGDTNNLDSIQLWIDSFTGMDNNGMTLDVSSDFRPGSLGVDCTNAEPINFMITDACGQVSEECVVNIVQADTQEPAITSCPASTTIDTGTPNLDSQISQWLAGFTAEDMCNTATISNDYALLVQPFDCMLEQDVIFTAIDECGNVNDDCVARISFENNQQVFITCPTPIQVICNDAQTLQIITSFLSEGWTVVSEDDFEVTFNIEIDDLDLECNNTYTQDIIFTVMDNCQNSDECSSSIEFIPNARVYIPNTFSPSLGGDDSFLTIGSNIAVPEIQSFRIYSRWGDLMYEAENFDPNAERGWDGRSQFGSHVQGVYTYRIQYVDIFNNPFDIIGTITLL